MSERKFYEYEESPGMIVCEQCHKKAVELTKEGKLVGDEAVTDEMATEVEEATQLQCDVCLYQTEDYDEVLDDE